MYSFKKKINSRIRQVQGCPHPWLSLPVYCRSTPWRWITQSSRRWSRSRAWWARTTLRVQRLDPRSWRWIIGHFGWRTQQGSHWLQGPQRRILLRRVQRLWTRYFYFSLKATHLCSKKWVNGFLREGREKLRCYDRWVIRVSCFFHDFPSQVRNDLYGIGRSASAAVSEP